MLQAVDMVAIVQVFRDARDGRLPLAEADTRLAAVSGDAGRSNGSYHGKAGYRRIVMAAST
jgi:O2-independent ubiquinone biosynthesis protein UbiV